VDLSGAQVLSIDGKAMAPGRHEDGSGPVAVGPDARAGESVVDPALLGPGQLVVDLVYHPLVTPLLEAARARGAIGVSGLGMLIHQAAHAVLLWTAEDPPLAVMSAAALAELAK